MTISKRLSRLGVHCKKIRRFYAKMLDILEEVNDQGGRTICVNGHVFVFKASHTVIVDFGCGQHKKPGEGCAPSG